ncbi:MAG: hypothetical protein JNM22_15970 [Saprospiraceae bacterium]|nr:hypothetical protein [Saprospiraceae bacterium]
MQKTYPLVTVTKIVEQDVADKVDTSFIASKLNHLKKEIGITYVCTNDDRGDDDWVEEGVRYIVIKLPYDEVKRSADIRFLMLAKLKERLGEVA